MRLGTLLQLAIATVVLSVVGFEFVAAWTAVDCIVDRADLSGFEACSVAASCADGVQRAAVLASWEGSWESCPDGVGAMYSPLYGGLRWTSLLDGYILSIVAVVIGVPLGVGAGYLNPRRYEPAIPDAP